MEAQLHQTREARLNYVAQRMARIFESLRAPLPAQLRIAIGFTSSGRRKNQHSRPIKCACSNCGYTVHTTRKWLDLAGASLCPMHDQMDMDK